MIIKGFEYTFYLGNFDRVRILARYVVSEGKKKGQKMALTWVRFLYNLQQS